jgi:aminoglycoside phosphotransferase (APT) family kinase protein
MSGSVGLAADPKIPQSVEDVTLDWLQDCLHSKTVPDRLASFAMRPIGEGFGQTGMAALIELEFEEPAANGSDRPDCLVLKMATPDERRRDVARSMGLYEREVRFYQTMSDQLDVRVPKCYFAHVTPDGGAYALLLEGFPGHRPGDETIGCSVDDAKLGIIQLAKLHAPNWDGELSRTMPRFPAPDVTRYKAAWDQMIESFGTLIPYPIKNAKSAFFDSLPALVQWVEVGPITVIHADFKLDNLLFGEPGSADPIVVLDWQAIRPGKGIQDFAYLIGQNMHRGDRRDHEEGLLALYCDELSRLGVDYDLEQARQDYRTATLYLWSYVVGITGLMVNRHERAIRRKTGLIERASSAILDHDALALLPFSG